MTRSDGRAADQLRPVTFERGWSEHAEGSALVSFGRTKVLCTASFSPGVPRWLKDSGTGWVTAEYSMLPRATNTRNQRESVKGKLGGRTQEISRLIGRSLRAVVDMKALGENSILIDCDVLQADGGTRTAAITGAYVALVDSITWAREQGHVTGDPMIDSVAAVSVGIVDGEPDKVTQAQEQLAAWNQRNPDARIAINRVQIARMARDMRATREDRVIRAAPKELRGRVAEELR